MDPYFCYQYGSGLERESSRFTQPGDFFTYTAFCAAFIVVSRLVAIPFVTWTSSGRIDYTSATRSIQITLKYLPAQSITSSCSGSWNRGKVPLHIPQSQ
jgi:hypothetical protein